MIDHLKNVELIDKVGGKFKLTALIQKRMLELMQGSRPLIENTAGKTMMEVAVEEIMQDKVGIDPDSHGPTKTGPVKRL
ncbi:MAG: hypothetical protein A2Y07_05825 [Planctomycetes bacterium GWF2_50_10]|nr:MAG: hypothetical protein A2Y07_05825 [Planctomycetes bacterium GWF2_50_10]